MVVELVVVANLNDILFISNIPNTRAKSYNKKRAWIVTILLTLSEGLAYVINKFYCILLIVIRNKEFSNNWLVYNASQDGIMQQNNAQYDTITNERRYQNINQKKPIRKYSPIIHNNAAVKSIENSDDHLKRKGFIFTNKKPKLNWDKRGIGGIWITYAGDLHVFYM